MEIERDSKKIIKKLVERYRWRKMIEAARALKELEARKVQKLREQQDMTYSIVRALGLGLG